MPEPARKGQRYMPGLDGLRAIAVLAVLAYHLQFGWAQGGLLGVGVFFTLSGYLITDLLLGQWAATGRLQLLDFWRRRARRLLPALFVMLAVVTAWVTLVDRGQLAGLRGMIASAAGYYSNWWLIAQHSSYFAQFGPPSPLGHLWSLAVEEQFYLLWPWLLLLGVLATRVLFRGNEWLTGTVLALAALSAAEMAWLYHPGYDPTRVYDGTDTRAFALLIGAALAFGWPSRERTGTMSGHSRKLIDGIGLVGLAGIGLLVWRTGEYSPWMYRGGLVLLAFATAAVVFAAASPYSRVGAALGWGPLRWIGVRSYGIYLWHFPVIVLTMPSNGRETLGRAVLQAVACVGIAALSWRYVEEPIRRGGLTRLRERLRAALAPARSPRQRVVSCVPLGGATAVAGVAVLGLAGVLGPATAGLVMKESQMVVTAGSHASAPIAGGGRTTAHSSGPRTSCRAVAHFGDSTSDGLFLPAYQPDAALRSPAQYERVGVRRVYPEVEGGTSIVETIPGTVNAYALGRRLVARGYRGCWVFALGTNDTADIFVGSNVGMAQRIARMMSLVGDRPALWVNVRTLRSSGPYAEQHMRLWNRALLRACRRYPNMRVYDWASAARPAWFVADGIHYTPSGYAQRARRIANALAAAFPAAPDQAIEVLMAKLRGWYAHLGAKAGGGALDAPSCVVH